MFFLGNLGEVWDCNAFCDPYNPSQNRNDPRLGWADGPYRSSSMAQPWAFDAITLELALHLRPTHLELPDYDGAIDNHYSHRGRLVKPSFLFSNPSMEG
jgi:hypothetical protein